MEGEPIGRVHRVPGNRATPASARQRWLARGCWRRRARAVLDPSCARGGRRLRRGPRATRWGLVRHPGRSAVSSPVRGCMVGRGPSRRVQGSCCFNAWPTLSGGLVHGRYDVYLQFLRRGDGLPGRSTADARLVIPSGNVCERASRSLRRRRDAGAGQRSARPAGWRARFSSHRRCTTSHRAARLRPWRCPSGTSSPSSIPMTPSRVWPTSGPPMRRPCRSCGATARRRCGSTSPGTEGAPSHSPRHGRNTGAAEIPVRELRGLRVVLADRGLRLERRRCPALLTGGGDAAHRGLQQRLRVAAGALREISDAGDDRLGPVCSTGACAPRVS